MPADPKRHQRALERRSRKRKGTQGASRRRPGGGGTGDLALFRRSGDWPLHEVLLTEGWEDPTTLTEIVVARRSPMGHVAVGMFLVDLACLGVKNAFASLFGSTLDYERRFRTRLVATRSRRPADLDLAAKIIREAVGYAHGLGLEPHPHYHDAKVVLGGADPDACATPIPRGGPEGKPFFVSGPDDDAPAIMSALTRKLGPDGFHYLVMATRPADEDDDGGR